MAVLEQFLAVGSASGGWSVFMRFYSNRKQQQKRQVLMHECFEFRMKDGEPAVEYSAPGFSQRNRLAALGISQPDEELNYHSSRCLSDYYGTKTSIIFSSKDLQPDK